MGSGVGLGSHLDIVDTYNVYERIVGIIVHEDGFDVDIPARPGQAKIVMVIPVIPFGARFTD